MPSLRSSASLSSAIADIPSGVEGFTLDIDGHLLEISSNGDSATKIIFAELETGVMLKISLKQLWEVMKSCAKVDGELLGAVDEYKAPLNAGPLSPKPNSYLFKKGAYHEFITIRVGQAWWSFERLKEGILVQRSCEKEEVIRKSIKIYRYGKNILLKNIPSKSLGLIKKLKTVENLISSLELVFKVIIGERYHLRERNCQHFVARVLRKLGFKWNMSILGSFLDQFINNLKIKQISSR
ncbi:uncharacterized protein LOC108682333 [Hyalella azteca]|uniref:Uncharacterized protein LOC108682333 n=1 Tax=Hyalella azteca TaxID=294128 RepID=A0A8B7PNR2_HYAAZ|nr:uncharacterized protein LOC108682333 [Hyalella azteca]XP_047737619.1 uncharacterized protein LOC108682333 [Hyalella azteca]